MIKVDVLRNALEETLRALTRGDARVENLKMLAGGASQETWALDLFLENGEPRGEYALVLRRHLGGKIYRDALDLWREFHVMQVAYASNVAVPYPQAFLPDLLGRPAALIHYHAGETIGRRLARESIFENARKLLPAQMGEMLARIHRIDFEKYALLNELPHPPPHQSPAQWMLAQLENNLDAILQESREPHPALELAIRWLRLREPAPPEKLALLHGDYRIGNVIVVAEGLSKVLDWEFAHLGDPYEDLAWSQVRDWRFGYDHLRFGGVAQPDDFFAAYGRAMHSKVDLARAQYWQVMGNARWAVGMLNQAQRHLRGAEPNLEFASLGRRCAEVELEILRLIRA
ncbi:MAG: phosphotransferase [Chloroflexota bacterium]|nr:MAG: phosphotransferase [Chloroflexota bacterium]